MYSYGICVLYSTVQVYSAYVLLFLQSGFLLFILSKYTAIIMEMISVGISQYFHDSDTRLSSSALFAIKSLSTPRALSGWINLRHGPKRLISNRFYALMYIVHIYI
jgi:hypothetical protein